MKKEWAPSQWMKLIRFLDTSRPSELSSHAYQTETTVLSTGFCAVDSLPGFQKNYTSSRTSRYPSNHHGRCPQDRHLLSQKKDFPTPLTQRDTKPPHTKPFQHNRPNQQFQQNLHNHKTQQPSKPFPSPRTTSDWISKILGVNGKLREGEKVQRVRLGLCPYCGDEHKLEDCKKTMANQSKNV